MSTDQHADVGTAHAPPDATAPPQERSCPNVSGDLATVLEATPMFRRSVAGYDRFQVDTYVRWAEDELATADRERERLLARHLRTRAALDEARGLLAHSPTGGEFLRASRRVGSMLAAAADEAESIRAEASAERAAASAESERVLGAAEAGAEALLAEATAEAEQLAADARQMVDHAERTLREACAEAEARLAKVSLIEQRSADHVEQLRRQAVAEAAVARLQARDEVVRMLDTAREQRRRADAVAAATREGLESAAATRYSSLLAEVAVLEARRSALQAEVDLLATPVSSEAVGFDVHLRRFLERLHVPSRYLRAP